MIKIIAFIAMTIDHINYVYQFDNPLLLIIGRLAFPLFAWGIAAGSKRTSNSKRYAMRLLLIAVVSQVPYWLLFNNTSLNVCFTLLIGLCIIEIYESRKRKYLKWLYILGILIISDALNIEYGIYGLLIIFTFYKMDKKNYHYIFLIQILVTLFGVYIYNFKDIQFIAVLSIYIVTLLQKSDFKLNKWFQYSFYPLHLVVLLCIKYFLI